MVWPGMAGLSLVPVRGGLRVWLVLFAGGQPSGASRNQSGPPAFRAPARFLQESRFS